MLVIEQVAAARWGDDGLLNSAASSSRPGSSATSPPELARLSGPQGYRRPRSRSAISPRRAGSAQARSAASTALRLDARGAWELDLANGVTVRLGRRQVDERFDKFMSAALASSSAARRDISYVDMRYTNGFAIGWRALRCEAAMLKRSDRNLIVGLDIGTSKVVALVGRGRRRRRDRGAGHRLAALARPEEGRGRQHRVDGAVDPARGRGSRAHGRLRDPLGVRRHRRQPRAQPQLARRRGDPRQGSHARRRRARDRCGQGGGDSGRPEDPARAAAGVHRRRPGRHPRSDRHVGRAPRGQGAHRHRRGQRGAEHREVHPALRPRGRRRRARAAGLELRGADRRREGAGRLPGRHRRRHDRPRGVRATARSATRR